MVDSAGCATACALIEDHDNNRLHALEARMRRNTELLCVEAAEAARGDRMADARSPVVKQAQR